MAEVVEPLGWKKHNAEHIDVGFKTQSGEELRLILSQDGLRKLAICAIDATAAFPMLKGQDAKRDQMLLQASGFELSRVIGTSDLALTFFRENGAHISFRFDQAMSIRIQESLAAGSSPPEQSIPPSGVRH